MLLVLMLGICGCTADMKPVFVAEKHPVAIVPTYKQTILAWAKGYFAEPSSLRDASISDPVPIRTFVNHDMWLVCVAVDARQKGGGYMGQQVVALAFGPVTSAPLDRSYTNVSNADCQRVPLSWRPFPELERLSAAPRSV